MRRALIISVTAHVAVVAIGFVGLPALRDDSPLVDNTLIVDVVVVEDETNVPTAPPPDPPKKAEKPPPPPPAPKVAAPPPQIAALPPEPAPKVEAAPRPKEKPKPEAKPKPEVAPKPVQRLAKVRPRRKPKPPDPFASVLRTVEKLKKQQRLTTTKKEAEKKKPPSNEEFKAQMARAISQRAKPFDASRPMTASQIDLVRQQIFECWSVQAGSKGAEDMIVEIHIVMNRDGFVRSAKIVDSARVRGDKAFRTAAESALRAVLNKHCQPFKLPKDRYDQWQTITMMFNPGDMF